MARRKRKGEYVCNCYAYKFPHRMFGGRCSGQAWVEALWEKTYGTSVCGDCALCYQEDYCRGCEVCDGRESPLECPELQAFVEVNEIKAKQLKLFSRTP